MRKHWKPVLSLMLIALAVAGLISFGAGFGISLAIPYVLSGAVAYGVPALLVRETAVRFRMGVLGVIALGFSATFLAEGLFASTLTAREGLPLHAFDGYGYFFSIAFAWAAFSAFWHTFIMILFPIALVSSIYPNHAHKVWLGDSAVAGLAAFIGIVGAIGFIGSEPAALSQLIVLVSVSAAFAVAAFRAAKEPKLGTSGRAHWPALFTGATFFIFSFYFPSYFPGMVPAAMFLAYLLILGAASLLIVRNSKILSVQTASLFGIGWLLALSVFAFERAVSDVAVSSAILASIILLGLPVLAAFIMHSAGKRHGIISKFYKRA